MVRLDRIYTRSGDQGETSIGNGTRVSKLDVRIVAGGAVDELNSHIGQCLSESKDADLRKLLQALQQQLFDLGADVTCPWIGPNAADDHCPRVTSGHVQQLESRIDEWNQFLQPLQSFILPGGSRSAVCLHLARSICRRAEVDVLRLQSQYDINPELPVYLNRLSDLLFVLARAANENGATDVLWEKGVQQLPEKT